MKFVSNLYRKLFERAESHAKNVERAGVRGNETAAEIGWMKCFGIIVIRIWAEWRTNWQLRRLPLLLLLGGHGKNSIGLFFNLCFCLVFLYHFYFHFHFALYHVIERPRCVYALSLNLMWMELNWIVALTGISRTVSISLCFSVARLGLLSP